MWKQEKSLTSAATRCLYSSPDSKSRGRRMLGNTYCGQVLLCHALALPTLLDYFAHLQGNSVMVQLFCLSVELGCVLCDEVLFVLACCPYHSKQEQKNTRTNKTRLRAAPRGIKTLSCPESQGVFKDSCQHQQWPQQYPACRRSGNVLSQSC